MADIIFSDVALGRMTSPQQLALLEMVKRTKRTVKITVHTAFDLPTGYLAFTQFIADGDGLNNHSIYGGISPTGDIST